MSTSAPGLFRDTLLLGLMLLIVWMPIPLGSNRVGYWSLDEILIALLMLVWLIQFLRGKRAVPETFRAARPLYLLLGAWCVYVLLQCIPLPVSWVAWLSPQSAWLHNLTLHPENGDYRVTLSVDPFSTETALGKSIAYLLLVLLVLLLVDTTTRLKRLAYAIVAAGFLQAVIGLIDPGFHGALGDRSVTGTFPNRNHLANLLTLAIATGLGILLATSSSRRSVNRAESLRRALDWILSSKMLLRASLLLMATAIVLTRSRMGNLAFFTSMLVAGLAMLALARKRKRGLVILLGSMIVVDILIVGSMLGMDRVVKRFEDTSLAGETRDEVARDTLRYWRDYPLTGSGLGSFYVTFPRYKQGDIVSFSRQAHNDYLQFGAESGVIGIALLGGALLLSLWTALQTLRRRRHPWAIGIAFSVVMAISAIMIHATVEFNLQIFANAAFLSILLPLAWVAARLPSGASAIPAQTPRPRFATPIAVIAMIALTLYIAWIGAMALSALVSDDNEKLLAGWERDGRANPHEVLGALHRQLTAIQLAPHSADAKTLLARLAWWQLKDGQNGEKPDPARADKVHGQMLYALLGASRDNPGLGSIWASILATRHFQRRYDALFQAALRHIGLLTPWEMHLQLATTRVGLAAWDRLDNTRQREMVADAIQRGLKLKPRPMRKLIEASGLRRQLCEQFDTRIPHLDCGGTRQMRNETTFHFDRVQLDSKNKQRGGFNDVRS